MNSDESSLPLIAAIFRGVKSGRHWCFGDPEYDDLNGELFDRYQAFFAQLELKLHRDARGFIYATTDDDDTKGSGQITAFVVFTAVWVDAVADSGEDVGRSLFAANQVISDLPHFRSEAHRRVLAQVGMQTPDDLEKIMRSMARLGLLDLDGQGRFTLRAAYNRLLDVCLAQTQGPENPSNVTAPTDARPGQTNAAVQATDSKEHP